MIFTVEALARNIKKYRNIMGLTQVEIASQLNVSFQTVSKWENGKSVPDTLILPQLAQILKCTIDDLFCYRMSGWPFFVVPDNFVLLWRSVEQKWDEIEKEPSDHSNKQVIALLNESDGAVTIFVNDICDERSANEVLEQIASEKTNIDVILCMWSNREPDLPSYTFRKRLCETDPKYKEASIILVGDVSLCFKSLDVTMPEE